MFMPESVFIRWFDEPAHLVSRSGPIHGIHRELPGKKVLCYAKLFRVNPLGADTNHELRFLGKGPRLLEQHIRIPLDRVRGEKWCGADFHLQPPFYRREFNSEIS